MFIECNLWNIHLATFAFSGLHTGFSTLVLGFPMCLIWVFTIEGKTVVVAPLPISIPPVPCGKSMHY